MLELQVEEASMPGEGKIYDDYKIVDRDRRTFIVADGIGGHQASIEVSSIASNVAYGNIWAGWNGCFQGMFPKSEDQIFNILAGAVEEANTALHTLSDHLEAFAVRKKLLSREIVREERAGTTIDICYFSDDNLYLAHVGDGYIYLLRDSKLIDLTRKTDPGIEMVREKGPRHKGLKNSYVGREESIEPYMAEVKLQEGDVVLMSTDGLPKMLEDEQIAEILQKENAASNLVKECEGSMDAVTAVVLKAKNV